MATNETAAAVFSRTRSLLNDAAVTGGSVATDGFLLPFANDAYDWLALELMDVGAEDLVTKRVKGLAYVAGEDTLDNLVGWPTDLFLPLAVQWRPNSSEDYFPVGRVDELPEVASANRPDRLTQWTYLNRKVQVLPATQAGQVLIDYQAILTTLANASSPILLDKAVPAMAHYTAALTAQALGQAGEAERFFGRKATPERPGWGAAGFAERLVSIWVKNEQLTPRRGKPLHGATRGGLSLPRV